MMALRFSWLTLQLVTAAASMNPDLRTPLDATPSRHWEIALPRPSTTTLNPSGLLRWNGEWLIVSDKKEHPSIYRLFPKNDRLIAEPLVDPAPAEAMGKRDLEGLAFCRGRFFMVEESDGLVIEMAPRGKAVSHRIDLTPLHEERAFAPAFGTKGAGLEGIACDDDSPIYVANERQYRMIYVVDPDSYRAVDFFDVPGGWDSPRFVATKPVYPDFADLFFERPYLYALQRNDRLVLKIDPVAKKLLAVLKLKFDERDYYDYSDPFGMAEGLALTRDKVYVLLDNNDASRRGQPENKAALLIEFARPADF